MNVLLLGASGPLGREVVKHSTAHNHQLSVLVRDPAAYKKVGSEANLIEGDALDQSQVLQAITGQDAVIYSLGSGLTFKHVTLFSDSTRILLGAAGVQPKPPKLIVVTGIGAGESRGHGGFLYDKLIEPTVLRTVYEDKDRQEQMLRESGLHWVGVRPGILTNDEAKGDYKVYLDLSGITVGKIARADVADFLLKQVDSDEYLHQFPTISY